MDPTIPDRDVVIAALDRVLDPKTGKGLAAAGLVRGLTLGPGRAGFMLEVAVSETAMYAPVRDEAQAALSAVPGVAKAQVVLTSEHAAANPLPVFGSRTRSRAAITTSRTGIVGSIRPFVLL